MGMSLTPIWTRTVGSGPIHDPWAVNLDGRALVPFADQGGGVRLFDPTHPGPAAVLSGPAEQVNSVCPIPSANGEQLVVAAYDGKDGVARVWSLRTGTEVSAFGPGGPEVMCAGVR
jgi:WD40 repeat protein